MAFTHTIGISYTVNSGAVVATQSTQTGDEEFDLDIALGAGAVNTPFDYAFTLAAVRSILLTSDQAVTIKTNSSGSPQETISLAAGQSLVWQAGGGFTAPFAGNITKFYLSNPGTVTANFKARVLANQ